MSGWVATACGLVIGSALVSGLVLVRARVATAAGALLVAAGLVAAGGLWLLVDGSARDHTPAVFVVAGMVLVPAAF